MREIFIMGQGDKVAENTEKPSHSEARSPRVGLGVYVCASRNDEGFEKGLLLCLRKVGLSGLAPVIWRLTQPHAWAPRLAMAGLFSILGDFVALPHDKYFTPITPSCI
ncbi:MAG: hypothetical protein WCK42_02605 [Myxococcaceae bacterium]